MTKLLSRLVTCLLVPCLLADPTLAAALTPSFKSVLGIPSCCFQQQALNLPPIFQIDSPGSPEIAAGVKHQVPLRRATLRANLKLLIMGAQILAFVAAVFGARELR